MTRILEPVIQQYLKVLQAPNLRVLADRIVEQVKEALRNSDSFRPPIRLSTVADQFQILPMPRQDGTIPRGKIEYDSASARFVISLSPSASDRDPEFGDDAVPRAQRFSYAHEFAHRFLFVERDHHWVRAVHAVAESGPPSFRLQARRVISNQEEILCNEIAGRLLVPGEMLDVLASKVAESDSPQQDLLWSLVSGAMKDFQVSRWCAFRQISRRRPAAILNKIPHQYCCLIIGYSNAKGSMRGRPRLRVLDYWWPDDIEGMPTRPLFPGIATANLGQELEQHVLHRVEGPSTEIVPLTVPIQAQSGAQENSQSVTLQLQGWSRLFSKGARPQFAVHGYLLN